VDPATDGIVMLGESPRGVLGSGGTRKYDSTQLLFQQIDAYHQNMRKSSSDVEGASTPDPGVTLSTAGSVSPALTMSRSVSPMPPPRRELGMSPTMSSASAPAPAPASSTAAPTSPGVPVATRPAGPAPSSSQLGGQLESPRLHMLRELPHANRATPREGGMINLGSGRLSRTLNPNNPFARGSERIALNVQLIFKDGFRKNPFAVKDGKVPTNYQA